MENMTPVSVAGAVIDAYQIDVKIKTRDNYGPGHPMFNAGSLIQIAAFTKAGIAAIDLTDDGVVFHVAAVRHMHSELLNQPIDMTPAIMETSDTNCASNTTLDDANGRADFYVANRGNNTIVRMRQGGTVVAGRKVCLYGSSLGDGRLNGIAASPDGAKL
jgi:hypothetical protein